MQPIRIVVLVLTIFISPVHPYHTQKGYCPTVRQSSGLKDVNRNFFNFKAWYIYAHTDPHPRYMSMFHIPEGLTPSPSCMRLFSETYRGLILLRYNCYNNFDLYQMSLHSDNYYGDKYQQMHNIQRLYLIYQRFARAEVIGTDWDSYVVFYGCHRERERTFYGLLFLVRMDIYDQFKPPPELMRLLSLKLKFNVTKHLNVNDQKCDCKQASRYFNAEIVAAWRKQQAMVKESERFKERFAEGIKYFFICVLSFALCFLCVNKFIDKFVFDLEY